MMEEIWIFLVAFWVIVILAYVIFKPIYNKCKEKASNKADEYVNGVKIRWDNKQLRMVYAERYKTRIEPVETDILNMFKELDVTITDYTEKYFVVPWKYILKWRHCTFSGDGLSNEYIFFGIVNEDVGIALNLNTDYNIDPVYIAFKKFASDKEVFERPIQQNEELMFVILTLLLFTVIFILVCAANKFL